MMNRQNHGFHSSYMGKQGGIHHEIPFKEHKQRIANADADAAAEEIWELTEDIVDYSGEPPTAPMDLCPLSVIPLNLFFLT